MAVRVSEYGTLSARAAVRAGRLMRALWMIEQAELCPARLPRGGRNRFVRLQRRVVSGPIRIFQQLRRVAPAARVVTMRLAR